MAELVVEAREENLEQVQAFVSSVLDQYHCSTRAIIQLNIAVEELFINIAHYAYQASVGTATVRVDVQEKPLQVSVTFLDHGIPYDPLKKEDPDVTLPLEERPIGGLGIYMVKQSMDLVHYEYRDGMNILTIQKKL